MLGRISSKFTGPAKYITESIKSRKLIDLLGKRTVKLAVMLVFVLFSLALIAKPVRSKVLGFLGWDRQITQNSDQLFSEGRETFRFDTFGDEHFWGDQLMLHKAIAGERFGGVGP